MRFPHLILVSLFVLSVTGCSKDDPVTPTPEKELIPEPKPEEPEEPTEPQLETYFTFNTGNSFDSSMDDDWIMIHNGNGDLLDYKPYEAGETLLFQALDTVTIENITVTKLQVRKNEFSIFGLLESYPKLDKGRSWNYRTNVASTNTVSSIGTFDLTVNNIPNWYEYNLRNKMNYGRLFPRRFHEGITGDTDPTNLILTDFDLFEPNDMFFSIIDENRNPKYIWFDDVQDGDIIEIDGSVELQDFDDNIDIVLPQNLNDYNYSVLAHDEELNNYLHLYLFGNGNSIPTSNSLRMGYLNAYDSYFSQVGYFFDDYSYYYSETSSRITPANINPVVPILTINDDSYSSFSYETSTEHLIFSSVWSSSSSENNYSKSLNWVFRGPKNYSTTIKELPEEFATLYPELDFDSLEYKKTTLNIRTSDWESTVSLLFGDKGEVIAPTIQESVTIDKE